MPRFKSNLLIDFIASTCSHKGQAIYANQEIISRTFLEDQQFIVSFLLEIKCDEKGLLVKAEKKSEMDEK